MQLSLMHVLVRKDLYEKMLKGDNEAKEELKKQLNGTCLCETDKQVTEEMAFVSLTSLVGFDVVKSVKIKCLNS